MNVLFVYKDFFQFISGSGFLADVYAYFQGLLLNREPLKFKKIQIFQNSENVVQDPPPSQRP